MRPLKVFSLIFCGVTIVWLVMRAEIFYKSLHANKFIPTNIQVLCQKEKNFLLTQDEPERNKLTETLQKTVSDYENKPVIYLITPTYKRPLQKAELTRLSHTLLLVPNVHWILVEDSDNKTSMVTNFLAKTRISFTHLNIPTPLPFKRTKSALPGQQPPRGLSQRNLGLNWLQNRTDPNSKGVVYFADDDNIYDLELFEEMRYTKKVSVWPVGFTGELMVQRPLVKNGEVVGWNAALKPERPFPIDMAGFAVSLRLIHQHPEARFSFFLPPGYQESTILKYLVTVDELEPKADNCTKVLVWNTRTEYPRLRLERKLSVPSNLNIEV